MRSAKKASPYCPTGKSFLSPPLCWSLSSFKPLLSPVCATKILTIMSATPDAALNPVPLPCGNPADLRSITPF